MGHEPLCTPAAHWTRTFTVAWVFGAMLVGASFPDSEALAAQDESAFVAAGTEPPDATQAAPPRTHLWVLRQEGESPQAGDGFVLLHRVSDDPPEALYHAFDGRGEVAGVAAHGDTLYCAYLSGGMQSFEFTDFPPPQPPQFRATQLPSLPRGARVVDLAASSAGPFVLIESGAADMPPKALRLLRLAGLSWQELPLPAEIEPARAHALLALQEKPGELALIVRRHADGARGFTIHSYEKTGWSEQTYDLPLQPRARFLALPQGGTDKLLVVQQPAGVSPPELHALLLREGSAKRIGVVEPVAPDRPWWAAPADDAVLIVTSEPDGSFRSIRVEFPDGSTSAWSTLARAERPREITPMMVVVIGTVVIGLLFLLLSGRREGSSAAPQLPHGVRPAAFNRIAAAAVDFAPALAASMIAFRIQDPVQVITQIISQRGGLDDALPGLLAVGLHVGHTTLTELFTASTLGKLICGCRVTDLRGQPPHAWQVLARNFCKIIEMLMPFFLLWPFVFSHFQRLGDLVGRTLVVSTLDHKPREEEPYSDDDDSDDPDAKQP